MKWLSFVSPEENEQRKRRAEFLDLMERYSQAPEDYDEECEEDPRPYLAGIKKIERFVCVTDHAEKTFFLPHFDNRYDAQARAVEFVGDDCFAEYPTEVYDLDTGTRFFPAWQTISWIMVKPAPESQA